MTDVRGLLRAERASRRIDHPQATYSTTGQLVCLVCQTQIKSESLWPTHLRSSQHLSRLQKLRPSGSSASAPAAQDENAPLPPAENGNGTKDSKEANTETETPARKVSASKKRKASHDDEEGNDSERRKRAKATNSTSDFLDTGAAKTPSRTYASPKISSMSSGRSTPQEMSLPSRPATPLKLTPNSSESASKPEIVPVPSAPVAEVDEDEWAAFEADIAAAEAPAPEDATIVAAPVSAKEMAANTDDDYAKRKEREERNLMEEKDDAKRRMEDELEEMEGLEARVRKLREKREALRLKENVNVGGGVSDVGKVSESVSNGKKIDEEEEDDDDESEDEDEWDGFRLRG